MKIFIETLGCKVNTYESEVIKEEFLRNGYELADNLSDANVIVVNTCSVTNQSDAKSRKVIRNARKNNKNAILVVCGCSSQNHQDELKDLGADILIGNKDKSKIFDYVNNYDNKQIINYYNMINTDFEKMSLDNYSERTRAFVKIQDGCNNYCSYCIIPYLRGTIRNKDLNDAINEINTLVNNGFKEIINKIREVRPDINITTDLIVGFPTETKEDFLESYNNAKEIKFGKIHVFPYSKRDGTVAAKMKSIVTDAEKKERTHKMITLSNKLENEYYNKFIDKTLSVLVEEVFDKYCTGHTDNYIKVIINKKLEHNKFYNVKIIKVDNCNVYGEVE